MVYTYTADNHQELVRAWVQQLRRNRPSHPFDPYTVVVPNMDMARWLELQLADAAGISANMRFVLPAAWLREQFEQMDPTARRQLLDKKHLQWMIYTLLEEDDGTAPWSHLSDWVKRISERSGGQSDALAKARWDITAQVADAFDQYIMYRPDWLVNWRGGAIHPDDVLGLLPSGRDVQWQLALWKEITRRWPDIPNRATLLYRFLGDLREKGGKAMKSGFVPQHDDGKGFETNKITEHGNEFSGVLTGVQQELKSGRFDDTLIAGSETGDTATNTNDPDANRPRPVVFAYGLTVLPAPTILAMARHARTADWHWFAQHHTLSENSYLGELNTYAQEQRNLFEEIVNREGVNGGAVAVAPGGDGERGGNRGRNLRRLQQSVITDAALAPDDADADSIRIHVCHSARREVEVLHDVLLDLFNSSDVRPGDVAVVTPDPDAYRPFVEEVFRGAGQQLAVHVAGARRGAGDIGAEVMLQALKLIGSRYKVPDVLDWLESEPVLGALTDRSGLRHTLHNWVLRQRIRWGIDTRQLHRAGFQLSGRHTWKHGIDRLLLSWMAAEGDEVVIGELLSGSTVAGQDAGALLGRLAAVIHALADLQEASESPQTIPGWIDLLQEFATTVFGNTDASREYRTVYHKSLLQLETLSQTLQLEALVPFSVVRRYLESALDTTGLGRAWRPGTITFTGMVALHQLPFRVVAILGLNDGKLPGKTPVSAFDLIPQYLRPGDRSRRDADRQLFLDYLLTPDLLLHLSYTGMRQKDNKDMAPSVMLTMLEDFFTEKLPPTQRSFLKNLKVKHALQPFSPKYFSEGDAGATSPLFSYSGKYQSLAKALSAERLPRKPLFDACSPAFTPVASVTSEDVLSDAGLPPSVSSATGASAAARIDAGLPPSVSSATGASAAARTDAGLPPSVSSATGASAAARTDAGLPPSVSSATGASAAARIDAGLPPSVSSATGASAAARTDAGLPPSNPATSAHRVEPPSQLTLGDLQQFFRDPVKALLRTRPGLSLDEADVPGESAEPFSFDSLTSWQIRSEVMRDWLESGELVTNHIEARLRREGALAEGEAGKRQMRVLVAELQDFVKHFEEKTGQPPSFSQAEVDVIVASASGRSIRISAMHPFMFGRTAWNLEAAKGDNGGKPRTKVRHYLMHLVLNSREPTQYRTVFRDGKELIFTPLSPAEARLRLGNFLSVFEAGLARPIPFFPAAMNVYLSALRDGQEPVDAFDLVLDELSDDPGQFPKDYHVEIDSIWVREAWGDGQPLQDAPVRELCTLMGQAEALTAEDFQRCQFFTLAATRVIDVMNRDILSRALDESDPRFVVADEAGADMSNTEGGAS
jgi:exonuclease V gamma subunit